MALSEKRGFPPLQDKGLRDTDGKMLFGAGSFALWITFFDGQEKAPGAVLGSRGRGLNCDGNAGDLSAFVLWFKALDLALPLKLTEIIKDLVAEHFQLLGRGK